MSAIHVAPSGEHSQGRGRYGVVCRGNPVWSTWAVWGEVSLKALYKYAYLYLYLYKCRRVAMSCGSNSSTHRCGRRSANSLTNLNCELDYWAIASARRMDPVDETEDVNDRFETAKKLSRSGPVRWVSADDVSCCSRRRKRKCRIANADGRRANCRWYCIEKVIILCKWNFLLLLRTLRVKI